MHKNQHSIVNHCYPTISGIQQPVYTSHQFACLFRCWPWPGTLQHNGSSMVYSHLSSSNWVFLSLLVFHSVIYSYSLPLSLSTFFFYLILTFAIFQCAERENSSSPVPAPSPRPASNPSPFSSVCISPEIWRVTGPSHLSTAFSPPPLSHIPSLSHAVHC